MLLAPLGLKGHSPCSLITSNGGSEMENSKPTMGLWKEHSQEPLLYLDGSTVFLYAGMGIARKMEASVLTSRMEQ